VRQLEQREEGGRQAPPQDRLDPVRLVTYYTLFVIELESRR
jgi:hypothetical protein